ncbi:unnamed protein product [Amoebophrya sp. A120]|nr:unnamed protein product [Amoebophrya sp. A120]|eukprot:GSA120T00021758001.1
MSPFRLIWRMVLVHLVSSHLAAHFPVAVTAVNLQQHLSLHRAASRAQKKLQKTRNIFANEIYDIAQDGCSCGCCIVTEVHRKLTCRRINLTTLDQANNEDGEPTGQCQQATCTEVSAGSWATTTATDYDQYCASYCSVPAAGGTSNAQRTRLNNAYIEGGSVSPGNGGATPQATCINNEDAQEVNELQHTGLKAPDYNDAVTYAAEAFGFRR